MTHTPHRPARLTVGAVVLATVLLAGCEAEPQLPSAGKAATEKTAVPAVAEHSPSGTRIDWKRAAYDALDCYPRERWVADGLPGDAWDAETVQSTTADVTGDGVDEVLVQVTCPAPTSTLPDHVVVFDRTTPRPELLGVLGDDLHLSRATVTVDGTAVTLSGATIAADDPSCCPAHWGSVTYRWTGSRFVVETQTEVPGDGPAAEQPADGEYVGMLHSVGEDELTVDLVEWFEGDDAREACREDGIENSGFAWCNDYYVRNADRRLVAAPVAGSASVSYLDLMTMRTVAVDDVAELAGTYWVSDVPDLAGYSRFRVEDGEVTELASVYTP